MGFADRLSYLKTKGTAEFTLHGVTFPPDCNDSVVLVMRHTEDVPEYGLAIDKWNAAKPAGIDGATTSPEQSRLLNEYLAKQVAAHLVAGWRNVFEEPGIATPCTPENVERFLLFMLKVRKRDIFTPTVNFPYGASNFTDAPVPNAVALGKE